MNEEKKARLAANGWKTTTVQEFLNLSPEEIKYIELKLALSRALRALREQRMMTQTAFAERIGSSQSRVAKMEKGDPTVSLDLLIKSLFALDVTSDDLGQVITTYGEPIANMTH